MSVTKSFEMLLALVAQLLGMLLALTTGRRRGFRVLAFEAMEQRVLLSSLPDLEGFNAIAYGGPDFNVHQSTAYWGQTVQIDFAVANIGGAASSGATYDIAFYLSPNSTIGGSNDYVFGKATGLPVPAPNTFNYYTSINLTLPVSNQFGTASPYYIGMDVNCDNTVTESNYGNNENQGLTKDEASLAINPPHISVTNSISPAGQNVQSINFGQVVDDGPGNSMTTQTLTITNTSPGSVLTIPKNGIQLANGTNFHIVNIISNKLSYPVDLSTSNTIAANNGETWLVTLSFDPTATGNLSDTLTIKSDDLTQPTVSVALTGIGLPVAELQIADSTGSGTDRTVNFGNVAVNGAGGTVGTATVTLSNAGSGPLTVSQNGITLPAGPFTITSIVSSQQGAINLASGPATIAAGGAETWTIGLTFDPTVTGLFQLPLTINSNDPNTPSATVSLLGTGVTPPALVVTDSVPPSNDKLINFGPVFADGPGGQVGTQTVTLTDSGQLPIQIAQNGITLANGTQFKVGSVVSSTQGTINVAAGPATIAPNGQESWTVTLLFDPSVAGALSDTLKIASNDPVNPTTTVGLSGTGLNQPGLVVSYAGSTTSGPPLTFPATLDDGAGGVSTTQTVQLTNIGTQPLIVSKNGIATLGNADFQVVTIVSSVVGAINLASGPASIAPMGAESWTVTVRFDPRSASALTDTLRIASNEPLQPTASVALNGQGFVPTIQAGSPAQAIHVSAGRPYRISWTESDPDGQGTVSLYYGSTPNPAGNLTAIVSGLSATGASYYDWQVLASLVGGTYYVFARIDDGSVYSISLAPGSLGVDAANTDRITSAPVVDDPNYTLTYVYNGSVLTGQYSLVPGDNTLYPTTTGPNGPVTHEYHVTLVPSLVDDESSTYDALGNVTSTTDADGQTTTYTYDDLSRLTQVVYADRSSVEYTYDAASNLTSMHDASGWQFYTYDVLDRLSSVTDSTSGNVNDPTNLTIGYQYDADNRLTDETYPSGERVEYGYDNAGDLTSVTQVNAGQPNLVTTYTYNATTGLLATETRPNDTETIYTYDTSGNLIDILAQRTSTSALIEEYHYTVDASGRRTMMVDTTTSGSTAQAYVYDNFGQLVQVTYSNDATIDSSDEVVGYTYDADGNRLTETTYPHGMAGGASQVLQYTYGYEDRLISTTDQNGTVVDQYSYDWRGNVVQKVTPTGTTLYAYDAQNNLVSVNDGANHVEYAYDGAGRRISETVKGVTTRYVVDPSSADYQTIEELNGSGDMTATYIYGLERIDGILPGSSSETYYLDNALGSVGALTNSSGTDLGNYAYDAFGQILSSPVDTPNPFAFAGEQFDPLTGLVNLRARQYDPSSGRFLAEDPSGFTNGPNLYVYVQGDPVNGLDPEGLSPYSITLSEINLTGTSEPGHAWATLWKDGKATSYGFGPSVPGQFSAVDFLEGVNVPGAVNQTTGPLDYWATQDGKADYSQTFDITKNDYDNAIKYINNIQSHNTSYGRGCGYVCTNFAAGVANAAGIPINIRGGAMPQEFAFSVGAAKIENTIQQGWSSFQQGWSSFTNSVQDGLNNAMQGLQNLLAPATTGSTSVSILDPSTGGVIQQSPTDTFPIDSESSLPVGGVLIDQAATLVNQNLKDITGATYDPTSHQLVFLGNSNPATVENINLGYFYTAIQAVYGSAVPPYVTIDPTATLTAPSFDLGNGAGVIAPGQTAKVYIHYDPYSVDEADDMTFTFMVNGTPVTARINGWVMNGQGGLTASGGGRYGMGLALSSVTGLSSGVTMTLPPFGSALLGNISGGNVTLTAGGTLNLTGGSGYTLQVSATGQNSYWAVSITNTTGANINVSNLQLVTDLQEDKFGGRVDGTQLGWVMFEADRVMKELAGGKDELTGAIYNSQNTSLPAGFMNTLELLAAGGETGTFSTRFWFTPNDFALSSYIDPSTGQATVVFSNDSVQLNTEAYLLGVPSDPNAQKFADFFNANYNEFANIAFPVHDPTDPTGQRIIYVKIFAELQDAMKAVALARFFRDNNIPIDTWWLSSYDPPTAYIPAEIPTLTNSLTNSNGVTTVTFYGGVQIFKPNVYVPSASAQDVQELVNAERGPVTNDVPAQTWSVNNTPDGNLTAVAASLAPQQQDGDTTLYVTDLSFASPGTQTLNFSRYYDSSFQGDQQLGLGWQPTEYDLEFQYPTWVDPTGLMFTPSGAAVPTHGADADTELRSGEIRFFDRATGQELDFVSSLGLSYSTSALGNPQTVINGLSASNTPTFTPGQYQDGSTLVQDPTTLDYILTHPDGSSETFESNGLLLSSKDNDGYVITYSYTNGQLTKISDSTGQVLTITYNGNGSIQSVAGPDSSATPMRQAVYNYDSNGLLTSVNYQALQSNGTYATASTVQYQYDSNNQLSAVIAADGTTTLTTADNLRGQSTEETDALGNMADSTYTLDPTTGDTTTQVTDMGTTGVNNPTAQGIAALQYVAAGSTSTSQFDATSRETSTTNALGNTTSYGYNGTSLVPNSVTLPTPNSPTITIQRNAANLPTVINNPADTGGSPEKITYNSANLPVDVIDQKGLDTHYTYTSTNDIATVTVGFGTPLAETTTYNYNATTHFLTSVVDPLGHTIASYTYDAQGRVLSQADGTGVTTSYQYDALGRLRGSTTRRSPGR